MLGAAWNKNLGGESPTAAALPGCLLGLAPAKGKTVSGIREKKQDQWMSQKERNTGKGGRQSLL